MLAFFDLIVFLLGMEKPVPFHQLLDFVVYLEDRKFVVDGSIVHLSETDYVVGWAADNSDYTFDVELGNKDFHDTHTDDNIADFSYSPSYLLYIMNF